MKPSETTLSHQVASFGLLQVLMKIRPLIMLPVLSRLIGPEGYGTFSIIVAFTALVQNVVVFGTNTALTVLIPGIKDEGRRSSEFWTLLSFVALTALVAVVFSALLGSPIITFFFPKGFLPMHYFIGLLLILTGAVNALLNSQIVNNRQAGPYAKGVAYVSIIDLTVVIASAWFWGVTGFLAATIVGQSLLTFLMVRIIRVRSPFKIDASLLKTDLGKYYAYGSTMFLVGIGSLVIESTDRFLIGKFLALSELGVYQLAFSLCKYSAELSVPIFSALMPFVVSAVADNDSAKAKAYLDKTYRTLLILYLPVIAFVSINARAIMAVVAPPAFAAGSSLLPLIIVGIALAQVTGVYTYLLHAHKKAQCILYSILAAAVFNGIFNLLLIPRYGIMGAALATLVAWSCHFLLTRYYTRKMLSPNPGRPFFIRMSIITGLFSLLLFGIRFVIDDPLLLLIASSLLGPALYFALLYKTKLLEEFRIGSFFEGLHSSGIKGRM